MFATKISMKNGSRYSNNPLDIKYIYIEDGKSIVWYSMEELYDFLLRHSDQIIRINIEPYQRLLPVLSSKREKYVLEEPILEFRNPLMMLPRID